MHADDAEQRAEERRLVRQALAGDERAIRSIVELYQNAVFGLCFRFLRHTQDAEDVTQEVLLRVFRSLRCWDRKRPLRTWILAIAVNRCRTHASRQAKRPRPTEIVNDVPAAPEPIPDHELSSELAEAIAELRPEYRLVVAMYHEQELPYEEISTAVGRPVGTIKTWLHRARAELARLLARRGVFAATGVED